VSNAAKNELRSASAERDHCRDRPLHKLAAVLQGVVGVSSSFRSRCRTGFHACDSIFSVGAACCTPPSL